MQLTRNKDAVSKHLSIREGAYFTDTTTIIEFPKWYEDKELYVSESVHYLYGLFAIIIGNDYSVSRIPTVLTTSPVMVTEVEKDGEVYINLHYGAGSKLLESSKAIMQPYLAYNFFDGFFLQAKVPWYIAYEDLSVIMDNTVSYGGTNLGSNQTSNELLCSFIARQSKDKRAFYRLDPKGAPAFVDLMDVRYSSLSTVNKLAGNYFNEALVSALVQKEKKPTTLEKHVRT